jgi:hypothetical protein
MSNYVSNANRWYGRVIDTKDPSNPPCGLVKVRIFGIHSDNKAEAPTEGLPWAMVQNSTNLSKSFSSLTEGDFVTGYYQGSMATQPIIDGTISGVLGVALESLGAFAPDSKDPIKTDMPNGLPPRNQVGMPTIGPAARGDVANTNISKTNANLSHSCDFRFFINLPTISAGGLVNPIAAIQDAIRSGKNQSAQLMGLILNQMNTTLRQVINALLPALGLDPSGMASKTYSVGKDIIRQINMLTKKIAMIAETASLYYNLVRDIQMIVDYLKSLPARLKAMVQACITQFLGSVNAFVNQLKSIPGLVSNTAQSLLDELGISTQNEIDKQNAAAANNTSNSAISDLVTTITVNADADHANLIMEFINTNYANANVVFAEASANTFSKSSLQSP